ncbi:MAG: cardiolipin synthase B, partial [Betaproteobacteria bacterium]
MAWPRRKVVWVAVSVLGTVAVTFVVLNLIPPTQRVQKPVKRHYATGEPAYFRALGTLLGPTVLEGNKVVALQNGREIFPAMLDAIRTARETVTFESYIYWSGDIGRAFAEALSERARAGVRVHLLLDWVGSQKIDDQLLATMKDAGVGVELYRPLSWYHLGRLNNRTHRKLLVVDGKVGFT